MRQRLQKYDLLFSLLLVLAVMALIFCFSAENGEESGRTSDKVVQAVIEVLYPHYQEMSRDHQSALRENLSHLVRKAAHFTEFAILGCSLMLFAAALETRKPFRFLILWMLMLGVLYAASDEVHQSFVGGRAASVIDVGIDSLGVLFGLLLVSFLQKQPPPRQKKEP